MRRRKCLGSTERKKPDGCRQETGCGVRKDSHTETEADKGYFAVQDKARKKFRHVRVPEREQVSSVGIGKSHTPIMENTFSFILYQIFFPLSRPAEKSRSCAAADELPDGETHIRRSTGRARHACKITQKIPRTFVRETLVKAKQSKPITHRAIRKQT